MGAAQEDTTMIDHHAVALSDVDAVRFALASLPDVPRLKPTDAAMRSVGRPCPLCGAALTETSVRWAWVVPPVHAPARLTANADRFACCAACAIKRGAADLVEMTLAVPGDLLARRRVVLQAGAHHVTAWRDRVKIAQTIAARVDQPRATVVAAIGRDGGAVVGWSYRCGGGFALGALVHRLRAAYTIQRIADGDPVMIGGRRVDDAVLFGVPAPHGLDALWALIDAGALMRPATPAVPQADDFRTAWGVHWYTMRHHLDRLDLTTLFPVPCPPKAYSDRPGAVRMRAVRAAHAART
jgi:hypothetical protein